MSKILVDTIDTRNGTTNLTIGSTNSSTVTFESGAVTGHMSPAFAATSNGTTTLTASTWTKVSIGTEIFDSNSDYDASTSRFTPTKAGKYFIYGEAFANSANVGELREVYLAIYVNGSIHTMLHESNLNNAYDEYRRTATGSSVVDANGSSDYYELYVHVQNTNGSPQVTGGGQRGIRFGAYRLGT